MKGWIISVSVAIVIMFIAIFACVAMLEFPILGIAAFIIILISGISTIIHDRFYS